MTLERIVSNWFRTRYRLLTTNGFLQPVANVPTEAYDPFNMPKSGSKNMDDLYLRFANLDVENLSKIEEFYNNYGPLGLMSREIEAVLTTGSLDEDEREFSKPGDFSLNVQVKGEIFPLSEFAPKHGFDAEPFNRDYLENRIVPHKLDLQKYAWEWVEKFKFERAKFSRLMDLYIDIQGRDRQATKKSIVALNKLSNVEFVDVVDIRADEYVVEYIDNQRNNNRTNKYEWWNEEHYDNETYFQYASEELLSYLDNEIRIKPRMVLVLDPVSLAISKEIQWRWYSLLEAMYIMLINDITEGIQLRRCINCGNYYSGGRPEMKYCGTSCQNRAKTRRYQEQIRKVQDMHRQGMKAKEIAKVIGKDVDMIEKWIEQGKD